MSNETNLTHQTKNCAYLYSIYDVDMGIFAPPFLASSHEQAMAMVRDAIDEGSVLHRFPSHYHLYYVGVFDSRHCFVETCQFCLCSVSDLVYRLPVADLSVQELSDSEDLPDPEELPHPEEFLDPDPDCPF